MLLKSEIERIAKDHNINKLKQYPCMGCRSFLTPYLDDGGNPKYYGRFNQGVVTINLPDVGLSAVKQMEGITYIDSLLSLIDVLVDGRFVEDLKDITLEFRGSSNQRIISMKEWRESLEKK